MILQAMRQILIFCMLIMAVCIYRAETQYREADTILDVVGGCLDEEDHDQSENFEMVAYNPGANDCDTTEEIYAQLDRADQHLVIGNEYRSIVESVVYIQGILFALYVLLIVVAIRRKKSGSAHLSP